MKQHYSTMATWLNKKWLNSEKVHCSGKSVCMTKANVLFRFVLYGPQNESKTEPKDVRKTPQTVLIISHSLEQGSQQKSFQS